MVELSSQRVRNRAAAVSALFDAGVTAVVCNSLSAFGVYSSRGAARKWGELQVKL